MDTEFVDLDYEDINEMQSSDRPDDFISIAVEKILGFDWFILIAVAISFLFIMSDYFADRVLRRIPNTYDKTDELSNKGYMVQLGFLLLGTTLGKVLFSLAGC